MRSEENNTLRTYVIITLALQQIGSIVMINLGYFKINLQNV